MKDVCNHSTYGYPCINLTLGIAKTCSAILSDTQSIVPIMRAEICSSLHTSISLFWLISITDINGG